MQLFHFFISFLSLLKVGGALPFVVFFNLHIHEDFYWTFYIVDKSEAVNIFHLFLFLFELVFIVVVDFFIRSYFYRQIELQKGFLQRGEVLSLFEIQSERSLVVVIF